MGGAKEADWNAVLEKKGPSGPTLTESHKALLTANAEPFAMLDSLKKAIKPNSSSDSTTEDEVRLVMARESLQRVVQDNRLSFDEAS